MNQNSKQPLNSFEQFIYNCFLKNCRKGQPWKPRKDFSNLEEKSIFYLKRLSSFFTKFSHIKVEDFFQANNILHPEEPYPPLSFFISRAAIKNYSLYLKFFSEQSPEILLPQIKEGFRHITEFCLKNKIHLLDYSKHITGNIPTWLIHCKKNLISPYCMVELNGLSLNDLDLQDDEKEIWLVGSLKEIPSLKTRYHNSSIKNEIKKIVKKLDALIQDQLKS